MWLFKKYYSSINRLSLLSSALRVAGVFWSPSQLSQGEGRFIAGPHREKKTTIRSLTHTCGQSRVHLTGVFLECGRKLEDLERTHTDTGDLNPRPSTGCSTNHCTTGIKSQGKDQLKTLGNRPSPHWQNHPQWITVLDSSLIWQRFQWATFRKATAGPTTGRGATSALRWSCSHVRPEL